MKLELFVDLPIEAASTNDINQAIDPTHSWL